MRVNLFGQATEGRSKQVTSQSRINCVIEQSTDKGDITAYQRNGTEAFATLPANFIPKAGATWKVDSFSPSLVVPSLFLVVGNNAAGIAEARSVSTAGVTALVATTPSSVSMGPFPSGKIAIGGPNGQFAVASSAVGSGSNVLYYDGANPFLFNIALPGTPAIPLLASSIAFLDRRYYLLSLEGDNNYIRWSPLDGGTYNPSWLSSEWPALNLIDHGFGVGLGIFTYGDVLVCFFAKGVVFYQTTTDPNLPIARVGSLLNDYRLESINSVALSGDTLVFLGSQTNRRGVFVMRGYNVERISTPDVEEHFSPASIAGANVPSCCGFFTNFRGHECYVLACPSIVLCYDFTSGTWGELARNAGQNIWQFGALFSSAEFHPTTILMHSQSNAISSVSNTSFRDNGVNNTVTLVSPVIYDETSEDRLTCSRVRIDVDYIAKGSVQPQLSISRDGGETFGSPISCNPPGYTVDGTRINRLEFRRIGGRARDWRFRLTYAGENPITVVDSFAEFEK